MICIMGIMTKGGEGYSELSGMIEWGQKSKYKKIPGKKINPQKYHAEFARLRLNVACKY